jgi:Zinc finger, C2H2 type
MSGRAQGGGEIHECERCGENFPTAEELQRHMRERHSEAQDMSVPKGTGGSQTDGGGGMLQTE